MINKARWKILDTGQSSAHENMELDDKLLSHIEEFDNPVLHLYEWAIPSATYGYFSKPEKLLNLEALTESCIEMARRPTGGGIIFHLTDFAFSILIPSSHPAYSKNTLENYAYVNNLIMLMLKNLNFVDIPHPQLLLNEPLPLSPEARFFCMAKPTIYDIIYEGKKIGGGAQRRTKKGILHQGSLSIAQLDEEFLNRVLINPEVVLAIKENAGLLVKQKVNAPDIQEIRQEIKKGLIQTILEL